jgi:hypothetical protein
VEWKADDGLQPVSATPRHWAKLVGPGGETGHIAWSEGELEEFAFDASLNVKSENARVISGVPNIQQFPIQQPDGANVASGCVPTAGASVVAFWAANGFPQWNKANDTTALVRRIRDRLPMQTIVDKQGITDGKMALAGALPSDLFKAIVSDAKDHGIACAGGGERFDFDRFASEINDGRPALLSCFVAIPQKPDIAWPHEVVGVGWARIGGRNFVGVVDNFFPTQISAAIRWIRAESFSTTITVRPGKS